MKREIYNILGKNKKFFISLLLITILFIVIAIFSNSPKIFHLEALKKLMLNNSLLAPIIFVFLQILQVIFAPIPGQAVGIVGGYFFGWKVGITLTMIGLSIGTFLVLFLSRKFGKKFVYFLNGQTAIKEISSILFPQDSNSYNKLKKVKKHGLLTFFLIMLLPAFPDDLVCFIAGLSNIPIRKLFFASVVGRFPGMLMLSLIGEGFTKWESNIFYFLFILIWTILAIIYFFRKQQIENFFKKLVKIN